MDKIQAMTEILKLWLTLGKPEKKYVLDALRERYSKEHGRGKE